jgi:AmiR/NasT family two-component response regulator
LCPGWDSNPHCMQFECILSAVGVPGRADHDIDPWAAVQMRLGTGRLGRVTGVTGKRVVIAEDEALIRMDLAEMLAEEGYDVVGQAGDGEEAIRLATEHRPDLVILDVKMPKLDGISAAEKIAGDRIAPVLMLTAFSQRELVERARDAGAMAYLVKPFSKADLLPAIEIAASRYVELAELEREVADLSERLETRKLVDRAKGILQNKFGLSEPDSFRWIQKTAMDKRVSMRRVAQLVVDEGDELQPESVEEADEQAAPTTEG